MTNTFKILLTGSVFLILLIFSKPEANSQNSYTVRFGPEELYNTMIAKQVRISPGKDAIVLEGRNFKAPFKGIIESDIIDPGDLSNRSISESSHLQSVIISSEATCPNDANIDLFVSFGNSFFSATGWTEWKKTEWPKAEIRNPGGKYCRFRLVLAAPSIEKSPGVKSLTIVAKYEKGSPQFQKELIINKFENEKLITSQFHFGYERKDNKDLALFVKQMGYDTLVSNVSSDLRKLEILNMAVARTPNHEHDGWPNNYPFDPREICSMQKGKMSIKGHCMSYAAVLINTLTAEGFYSRHWAANGFRDMDHEVVEVWVDSLRKWIYLDPSLSQIYLDPKTNTPLSLKEMHDIYTRFALNPGETFPDLSKDSLITRINARGSGRGKLAPIRCSDSGWHYGNKVDPSTYDWGWFHGYMVSGFLRMTDRNNYISEREPWFSNFGKGIEYNSHLHWIDDATPPRTEIIQTFTGRERDLWWSLNQASFKAVRTGEYEIFMEFGNSQPFFDHYIVSIDNETKNIISTGAFKWKLRPGENKIKVTPEDIFGKRGIPGFICLTIKK